MHFINRLYYKASIRNNDLTLSGYISFYQWDVTFLPSCLHHVRRSMSFWISVTYVDDKFPLRIGHSFYFTCGRQKIYLLRPWPTLLAYFIKYSITFYIPINVIKLSHKILHLSHCWVAYSWTFKQNVPKKHKSYNYICQLLSILNYFNILVYIHV